MFYAKTLQTRKPKYQTKSIKCLQVNKDATVVYSYALNLTVELYTQICHMDRSTVLILCNVSNGNFCVFSIHIIEYSVDISVYAGIPFMWCDIDDCTQ